MVNVILLFRRPHRFVVVLTLHNIASLALLACCPSILTFNVLLRSFSTATMAFVRAHSNHVPVTFSIGEDGYAMVSAMALCHRFQFRAQSVYVKEEVFDSDSGNLLHALGQFSFTNNEGKF